MRQPQWVWRLSAHRWQKHDGRAGRATSALRMLVCLSPEEPVIAGLVFLVPLPSLVALCWATNMVGARRAVRVPTTDDGMKNMKCLRTLYHVWIRWRHDAHSLLVTLPVAVCVSGNSIAVWLLPVVVCRTSLVIPLAGGGVRQCRVENEKAAWPSTTLDGCWRKRMG